MASRHEHALCITAYSLSEDVERFFPIIDLMLLHLQSAQDLADSQAMSKMVMVGPKDIGLDDQSDSLVVGHSDLGHMPGDSCNFWWMVPHRSFQVLVAITASFLLVMSRYVMRIQSKMERIVKECCTPFERRL